MKLPGDLIDYLDSFTLAFTFLEPLTINMCAMLHDGDIGPTNTSKSINLTHLGPRKNLRINYLRSIKTFVSA